MKVKRKGRILEYYKNQNGLCGYCDKPMTLDLGFINTATIDHVKPKSKGGKSKPFNEIAACYDCNAQKANLSIEEFLKKMKDGNFITLTSGKN